MPVLQLEKDRASNAWDHIQTVKTLDPAIQKRYRSQTRGGPAVIQNNGLGQFLTFLAAKGFEQGQLVQPEKAMEYADGLLYQHLGGYLLYALKLQNNVVAAKEIRPGRDNNHDMLTYLLAETTDFTQQIWATQEAQAYLAWSRRFAESQLVMPDDN